MRYDKVVLDKRSVLLLPLYDNKNKIVRINARDFYCGSYGHKIKDYIRANIIPDLAKAGGSDPQKNAWGLAVLSIKMVPEKDNAFDTTLLEVNIMLFGDHLPMIDSTAQINVTIRVMLVNKTNLITTLMFLVDGKPMTITAGESFYSLEKKERVYLEQFGEFAEQVITLSDLYEAIKSHFHYETQDACVALAKSMGSLINLMDNVIFKAFNSQKALPAIIETTLPNQ